MTRTQPLEISQTNPAQAVPGAGLLVKQGDLELTNDTELPLCPASNMDHSKSATLELDLDKWIMKKLDSNDQTAPGLDPDRNIS